MLIIAVTHVIIDAAKAGVWPPDSRWAIFAAMASAGAAIAMAILAYITRNLARSSEAMAKKTADLAEETAAQVKESASAIEQAERQHRESLSPLVYVYAGCGLIREGEKFSICFKGRMVNIGPGPSIGVNLLVKPDSFVSRWSYQGLIGAGESREFEFRWEVQGIVPTVRTLPMNV